MILFIMILLIITIFYHTFQLQHISYETTYC